MRGSTSLHILLASQTAYALIPFSDTGSLRRDENESLDDLDEWLAAAQRVSPEALKPCPVKCSTTKDTSTADWFLFPDPTSLGACNETMLLNMVVAGTTDDAEFDPITKACTADYEVGAEPLFVPEDDKAALCNTANRVLEDNSLTLSEIEDGASGFSTNHLLSAAQQASAHISQAIPSCKRNAIEVAYSQSAAFGFFAGAEVHQHGVATDALKNFIEYAKDHSISKTTIVQLCGSDERGADYSVGFIATSSGNLAFLQSSMKTWAQGECVGQGNAGQEWLKVSLRVPAPIGTIPNNNTNATHSSSIDNKSSGLSARAHLFARADCKTTKVQANDGCYALSQRCGISQADLEKYNRANLCSTLVVDELVCCTSGTLPSTLPPGNSDGTCKTRQVVSGDDCGSLASKCGISNNDFMKANNKTDLCSTLVPGQNVCCTDGKRPDFRPKQNSNGTCATYLTKKDDSCSIIAAARDLNSTDLLNFNKQTWGWNGCKSEVFYPDFLMCVSSGTPPMPAIVPNAVCGPTMNGTTQPPAGTNISMLNPCPLNVCCNIWGQCGISDDFCVVSKSETGAPGTSAPGKNGCISNCGRDIIKGSAPANKIKVAYFESWNQGRKCLKMNVDQIPSTYTHVHFAFPNVTKDTFKPSITDEETKKQFERFKAMKGIKKIVSFGGWAFSTEPGTYNVLRQAALPANRDTFKNNLISFMNEHQLDGIDLDWEYPGAPDIPDIPSDDPVNGLNYYKLLSSVKSAVGSNKSVSFAAPASYWYLKAFPIKQMAADLDYIIYMTYDLHGQWDYGNKWTTPGCLAGNCLRSHVNETETKDALSMITKAGAASNKVVVGVSSYGRSFKMEQAGCDGPMCKFTGSPRVSNANKGRCTDTGGYISNAEISEILRTGKVNKNYTIEGSNVFVYNDTEWVAYMDDNMKQKRSEFYDSYNFAGTTDWAVDLQKFWNTTENDDGSMDYDPDETWIDENYWGKCDGQYNTLDQLDERKGSVTAGCIEQYLVDVQVATLDGALKKYKDLIDNGYDKKFDTYASYTKTQIPLQINSFMASDKVDKYFKCKETKYVTCCRSCSYACPGCSTSSECKNGQATLDMDKCPKLEFELGFYSTTNAPNATYTLTDSDGFYKDLLDTYGIEKDWIRYDRRHMKTSNGCQYAGEKVKECIDKQDSWFYNYPQPTDKIDVYNPKTVIGDSFPKAQDMLGRISVMDWVGDWDEQTQMSDLVDATSIPGFSTQEAVNSMGKIVEQADEIEKRAREEMILNFITGFLFFIPIVGEVAGAAGLTAARTALRLIGSVGDAALTVYGIVDDPKSAFVSVFTYLLGAGVGRGGFRDAANSRRGISSKDYDSLGSIKTSLDKVQSIRGIMCPA